MAVNTGQMRSLAVICAVDGSRRQGEIIDYEQHLSLVLYIILMTGYNDLGRVQDFKEGGCGYSTKMYVTLACDGILSMNLAPLPPTPHTQK